MYKTIEETEFTIFDTETTGLDPSLGDRIVEIAAIRIKGEKKLAEFQTLINPRREISAGAFAVNHISNQMIQQAPYFEDMAQQFLDFIKGSHLCSYNAGFDLGFLNNELMLTGKKFLDDIVVIDVLKMSRRLMPGLERYALWFVAKKLGVESPQQHRAMADVEMTLEVFNQFRDMLREREILELHNFSALFALGSHFLEDSNNRKIAEIQQAIDLKVKLKIKYLSTTNALVTQREVSPKEIRQERGHSYLVGYCALRKEERSFRIDGILHLQVI